MDELISIINHSIILKLIFGALVGVFIYLIGSQNLDAFMAVCILALIDFITALYVLVKKNKRITSKKLPIKLGKLAMYSIAIMTMNMLTLVNVKFSILVDIAIGTCAVTEVISIMEHLSALGYKVPVKILEDLKKEETNYE